MEKIFDTKRISNNEALTIMKELSLSGDIKESAMTNTTETNAAIKLATMVECGILDLILIEEVQRMTRRERVLQEHSKTGWSIGKPTSERGRYTTYVFDKTKKGNRRKIAKTKYDDMIDYLFNHYFNNSTNTHHYTFKTPAEIYPMWLDFKRRTNKSDLSIARYDNYVNKYYKGSKIWDTVITDIDVYMVEDFYNKCIITYKMTRKELVNVKGVLKGIVELCLRDKSIKDDPFKHAHINTSVCRVPDKTRARDRVFDTNEKERFIKEMLIEAKNRPLDTDPLAILLVWQTGLRAGELVGLRTTDIDWGENLLYIRRMETHMKQTDGVKRPVITDKLKTPESRREIPLTDTAKSIIKRVLEINEQLGYDADSFLFVDEKGRTTTRGVRNRLQVVRKRANVDKSLHDIRRTVASIRYAEGATLEEIREWLGHTDIKMTKAYIYDPKTDNEKQQRVLASLGSLQDLEL